MRAPTIQADLPTIEPKHQMLVFYEPFCISEGESGRFALWQGFASKPHTRTWKLAVFDGFSPLDLAKSSSLHLWLKIPVFSASLTKNWRGNVPLRYGSRVTHVLFGSERQARVIPLRPWAERGKVWNRRYLAFGARVGEGPEF
jgi:hypothetical protein